MTISRNRVPALVISTVMASVLFTGCSTFGKSKAKEQARAISAAQAPNMGVNSFYRHRLVCQRRSAKWAFQGQCLYPWYKSSRRCA